MARAKVYDTRGRPSQGGLGGRPAQKTIGACDIRPTSARTANATSFAGFGHGTHVRPIICDGEPHHPTANDSATAATPASSRRAIASAFVTTSTDGGGSRYDRPSRKGRETRGRMRRGGRRTQ